MEYMKIIWSAILVIFLSMVGLFYLNSCEDSPTEPVIEYGRRDYVWEEDTLDVPLHEYVIFRDMVGNSQDDVWLGNLDPGLWHFDGERWELTEFPGLIPSALWLFEDNTLWVGTGESLILKRENGVWAESYPLTYEDYDMINIYGMYGKHKDDIYAVGYAQKTIVPGEEYVGKGIILHYNGSNWEFLDFPNLDEIRLNHIYYQENINTYFIWAIKTENGVVLDKLFTFDGKKLNEIISTPGSVSLSILKGIVYINYNYEVYKYIYNELVLWKDFANTDFLSNFVGRSENDFFNNSIYGVGHYNGKDYVTIYPTDLNIYSKIVFDKEVFITAKNSDYDKKYIIIHGTLKEENKE